MLMKSHGKSLPVQQLFVGHQFPLRSIVGSLASRSDFFRLFLRHANESIPHPQHTDSEEEEKIDAREAQNHREITKFSEKVE